MKHLILIFGLLFYSHAQAHEWDGDAWAETQINLSDDLMRCVTYLERSYGLFFEHCEMKLIYNEAMRVSNNFSTAMDEHPNNTLVSDFVEQHFKNKNLGHIAVAAIYEMVEALDFIKYKMNILRPLPIEDKKRIKDISA